MTNLCQGGGTSQAKNGIAETFIFGATYLGTLLGNSGNPWLIAAAAALGVISYDTIALCGTDPPPVVQLTGPQILSLENPLVYGIDVNAINIFKNNIANLLWPLLCQCNSGPQPSTPAPFIPPPNLPNSNPITSLPGAAACSSVDTGPLLGASYSTVNRTYPFSTPDSSTGFIIPAGVTGVQVRVTIDTAGASPGLWNFVGHVATQPNIISGTNVVTPTGGQGGPFDTTYPFVAINTATTPYFNFQINPQTTPFTQTNNARVIVSFYCGGATPGTSNTPCYPDPMTQALLQQILQLVTLIQRQAVPFAYILGATHPVTGTGSIPVQGLLGAIVTVTASGGGVTTQAGTPPHSSGLGWINWGTGDFYTAREFISNSPLGSFPCTASEFTSIGYSLNPGVTATIQEVKRES